MSKRHRINEIWSGQWPTDGHKKIKHAEGRGVALLQCIPPQSDPAACLISIQLML